MMKNWRKNIIAYGEWGVNYGGWEIKTTWQAPDVRPFRSDYLKRFMKFPYGSFYMNKSGAVRLPEGWMVAAYRGHRFPDLPQTMHVTYAYPGYKGEQPGFLWVRR